MGDSVMSRHQEWKMMHLLHRCSHTSSDGTRKVLTEAELKRAGVHCETDTWVALRNAGLVDWLHGEWELTESALACLGHFTIAKPPDSGIDIRVDYPEAFVIMPFGEPWSGNVYKNLFVKGIESAGFSVVRGDEIPRVGNLDDNVWRSITQAGVIVADVSVPNPNVYYEIGLAAALGKPVFVFKQGGVQLPADFGGIHYYEYDLVDLAAGAKDLTTTLEKWAQHEDHQPFGVKDLEDR
jgi:hypothetical protein